MLTIFFLLKASYALALSLENVSLSTEANYLVCSWELKDIPIEKLDETLHHGIPVRLQFEIIIEKIRRFWWDETLLHHLVLREIYYDAVKNVYNVQFVGISSAPRAFSSLEEALNVAACAQNLPLLPANLIEPGAFYRLKIKATIIQRISPNLPSRVLRIIFKGGKIESDWKIIRFRFSN